jgi:hypothetical protein
MTGASEKPPKNQDTVEMGEGDSLFYGSGETIPLARIALTFRNRIFS